MIDWNKLPAYAHYRIPDFGDYDEELRKFYDDSGLIETSFQEWIHSLSCYDEENIMAQAWSKLSEMRQQEIVEIVRQELEKQVEEIRNFCC